ncbi:MAG: VOC family protein, partial [Spirochaetes bacterium]
GFFVFERKELSGEWIDRVTGLKGGSARYAGLKHPGMETAVELLQYINPVSVL